MANKRFKTRGRQIRMVYPDGSFKKGMKFTDSFLDSDAVKLLVNYRIMDNGSYLMPRKGITEKALKVREYTASESLTNIKYPAPHVGFYGVYTDAVGDDTHGFIMVSFGVPTSEAYEYYNTDPNQDPTYYSQTIGGGVAFVTLTPQDGTEQVVDVSAFTPNVKCTFYEAEPKPVYVVHDSELFFFHNGALSKLDITFDNTLNKYKASIVAVTGKEVRISESTSIGFNMLDDDPYAFENTALSVDTLATQGVLPYDVNDSTLVRLSANPGERIKFVLYYDYYPGKVYRYKWEIAEYGTTEYTTLVDYSADTQVTNGAEISHSFVPTLNKFILRCTVAPYVGGAVDGTLAKVGVYPVYELGIEDQKQISYGDNFDLNTAKGMIDHSNHVVLWGVDRVPNTLFLSDGYDATYFPFPQNTFTFPEEILNVVSFYGSMFVFTARKLYVVEGTSINYMTDPYVLLSNVDFTKDDMLTVIPIKTGIFMRMNGMYYLLVPNSYTGKVSDMKLVNISTPVNDILFDPKAFIHLLSDRLYKFKVTWGETTVVKNYDFVNYVESGRVRNISRYVVKETNNGDSYRYHIDVVLVYDSDNGLWYTETASFAYPGLIASGSTLYNTYAKKYGDEVNVYLQSLHYDNSEGADIYNTMFYGNADNDTATSERDDVLGLLPATGTDTIVDVIDGDTVELLGLGRVRLLYINTPESTYTVEPYGFESKQYLKELLTEGRTVYYEFDPNSERADLYDRALVWLRLDNADGDLVQVLIARKGYVKSYYDFGATLYVNDVETAANYAVTNKLGLYKYIQPDGPYYIRTSQSISTLDNYQILDSGNRNQEPYMEKRYKEIQFMISNDSVNVLQFLTEFYIDSVRRKTPYTYSVEQITDPNHADYGTIYIVENEESNMVVANETGLSTWQLDLSVFPDLEVVKVVFRINGRGHYPRFILVSKNHDPYKILGYAWVSRLMSGR